MYYGNDNPQDYGLVNQMMINQFADQLVDSNFIDLTHVMTDGDKNNETIGVKRGQY